MLSMHARTIHRSLVVVSISVVALVASSSNPVTGGAATVTNTVTLLSGSAYANNVYTDTACRSGHKRQSIGTTLKGYRSYKLATTSRHRQTDSGAVTAWKNAAANVCVSFNVGKPDKAEVFTRPKASTPISTITQLPGQPALTAYGSSSAATPYAKRGALIIAGRENYADRPMKNASAAGATVLVYVDPIIDASYGRYHQMLVKKSVCGPATSRWPGSPKANEWGYLQDFRIGSAVQAKLRCVLEAIVAENPHIGGFFADDLGSRSWYPGFSWNSWGTNNQRAYRDGAVALAKTFHDVAVKHGLMVMVNGTWGAGSLASNGGGYPNANVSGLSYADGGYVEHHSTSELSYWTRYAKGQWGTASGSVSQRKPFMYLQASDNATRNAYLKTGAFAFLSTQRDYDTASVWGPFHKTGLPTRVTK